MKIQVTIEYDHVPTENGTAAGWWLVVNHHYAHGYTELQTRLPTKPTSKQIRTMKKLLKGGVGVYFNYSDRNQSQ